MSKIQDAFDSMLSELMAAKVRIGVLEEQERIARKTPASREIDLLVASEKSLKEQLLSANAVAAKYHSAGDVFGELYESCRIALNLILASGLESAIDDAKRLESAVLAARKIIDQSPF